LVSLPRLPPLHHCQDADCVSSARFVSHRSAGVSVSVFASARKRETSGAGRAIEDSADDIVAIWIRERLFKRPADQPLHAIVGLCGSVETGSGPLVCGDTRYVRKVAPGSGILRHFLRSRQGPEIRRPGILGYSRIVTLGHNPASAFRFHLGWWHFC